MLPVFILAQWMLPSLDMTVLDSGTKVLIRTADQITSKSIHVADTLPASVASPVVVGDRVAVPKDAHCTLTVTQLKQAGKWHGAPSVTLALTSITVGGKTYSVSVDGVEEKGTSRTGTTLMSGGLGAAIGAVIATTAGATGGGEAIGALGGAAAGAVLGSRMSKSGVTIPAETQITYTLHDAVILEGK